MGFRVLPRHPHRFERMAQDEASQIPAQGPAPPALGGGCVPEQCPRHLWTNEIFHELPIQFINLPVWHGGQIDRIHLAVRVTEIFPTDL